MTRYQHLATLLAEQNEQGLYRHGEKLPSVRSLSQEHGVSISTVQQAYQTLETMKLITPQPRSGYFVAQRKAQPPVPPMTRPVQRPVEITQWDQVLDMLEAHSDSDTVKQKHAGCRNAEPETALAGASAGWCSIICKPFSVMTC